MKTLLFASSISALLLVGCGSLNAPKHPSDLPLRYHNARYGLTFFLPASWQGYSVLIQQWDAPLSSADYQTEVGRERGPIIVFRHPQWKADEPHSDIPIVVFTRRQWDALRLERFSPHACGSIGELCHNPKYVFGVWNNAFSASELQGWREAADIAYRNMAANQ
jgi:hypothetical protein